MCENNISANTYSGSSEDRREVVLPRDPRIRRGEALRLPALCDQRSLAPVESSPQKIEEEKKNFQKLHIFHTKVAIILI
ncbi:Protein of unknown function [Gryllus bimaculatus]|nr:Protein of unknown function [Gryllus bimaculatus]